MGQHVEVGITLILPVTYRPFTKYLIPSNLVVVKHSITTEMNMDAKCHETSETGLNPEASRESKCLT